MAGYITFVHVPSLLAFPPKRSLYNSYPPILGSIVLSSCRFFWIPTRKTAQRAREEKISRQSADPAAFLDTFAALAAAHAYSRASTNFF